MENVNQVADPGALPIVPCPDCGRRVVTFVARRGQFAVENFYKWRNHNVSQFFIESTYSFYCSVLIFICSFVKYMAAGQRWL